MGKLWFGGTIYTMREENESAEAILTANGSIVAVGKEKTLRETFASDIAEEINLKGGVLYPGFVDSHLHLIGHGEKLLRLDFSRMTHSKEILEAVAKEAEKRLPGEWIIGEGWDENLLDDRKILHRFELDEVVQDHPMILKRVCRHAIIANTKALELAGITDDTPNPQGGVIVRDERGHATGYLLDQAQELVNSVMPAASERYLEEALAASVEDCLRLGLTGGHSEDLNYYGGFERTYRTFYKVIDGSARKFRAHLLVHHEALNEMDQLGLKYKDGNDYIELGAMKIFADGALGGRTALLSFPYNDDQSTSGVAIYSREELNSLVKKARDHRMPIAVHAIGDLAFEWVLDAIEANPASVGQRDRLIHGQILRKDLIERVQKLPVVVDIQPRFVASDFPWVIDRIGEDRMEYCYAWRTLLEAGLMVAGGSDAPIEEVDPLLGIHAAVTRKRPGHLGEPGFYPEQCLAVYEAIKLFTQGSASAIGREHEYGLVAEGYKADFTILDRDLFAIEPDGILEAKVRMTVVDETIMYQNGED